MGSGFESGPESQLIQDLFRGLVGTLSLQRDPEFRDRGAEGYLQFLERVESGYSALVSILGMGSSA